MQIVDMTQHFWVVLFTLGSIWNPLGQQDLLIIIIMEMNDDGIFAWNAQWWYWLMTPPPPLPFPYTFRAFSLFYWPPFFKLCESGVSLAQLDANL